MMHRILKGKGDFQPDTWFEMAENNVRATHAGADSLNIRVTHGRLEIRWLFFNASDR
jgi:hypothetical protein